MDIGGIIAGAIAGGAAGAGGAAKDSLKSMQDAQEKEDLMKHEQEAIGMREMALQSQQQTYQSGENKLNRDLTKEEGAANRDNTFNISAANNKTQLEATSMNNATTLKATSMNNATTLQAEAMRAASARSLAMANAGVHVIQDQHGYFVAVNDKTGAATPVTVGGQYLQGSADLPASTKAIVGGLAAEMKYAETPEQRQVLQQAMQDAASGKGAGPTSPLSAQKQQMLISAATAAQSGDPAAVAKWNTMQQQYDTAVKQPGAAAKYITAYTSASKQVQADPNVWDPSKAMPSKGGMPSAGDYSDTGVGTPGTPPLPSGGPNAGTAPNPFNDAPVNKPPLVNGQLPMPINATPAAPVDDVAATTAALAQRGTAQPPMPAAPAPAAAPVAPMALSNTQPGSPLIASAQRGMVMSNGRLVPAGTVGAPQF